MVLLGDEPTDKVLTWLFVERIFGSMVLVMVIINATTAITTTTTTTTLAF
jgi:hypothetical protein